MPITTLSHRMLQHPRFLHAVAALLLLPLLVTRPVEGGLPLGLPRLHGGDEPHYLLVLHSIIDDGDLDVANQYAAVHAGGHQAGLHQAGGTLDHHVTWFVDGRQVNWQDVFHVEGEAWRRDGDGRPIPTRRPGGPAPPSGPEYSAHPVGLPLLLAPFTWPLRGTPWVEPAALALSAAAVVLALFLFRRLGIHLGLASAAANAVSALAFLGTPAWFHARTLFNEPFLLLCGVAAAYFALVRPRHAVAGLWVGAGMLMKPPFALVVLPLAWPLARSRRVADLVRLGAGPALATLVVLGLHAHMFGAPWRSPQPWTWGNPVVGVLLQWVSPVHGMLPFAPVLLVALPGWWVLWRVRPDARPLLAIFVLQHVLMASWWAWHGGWCFGPRLLVPVMPFLALGLGWTPVGARMVRSLAWASVAINGAALLVYWKMWDHHPLDALFYAWFALRGV